MSSSSSAAAAAPAEEEVEEVKEVYWRKLSSRKRARNELKVGEQSRAAERFTWSEFQPIPPKGADLRLLWSHVVTANSLSLDHSMSG